jgi:hypothetical protein
MIKYQSLRNWKYRLVEPYTAVTPVRGFEHAAEFFTLLETGTLSVKAGYCWDGPSGPTWDSPESLRPSLVHDVFYQLLRMGVLYSSKRKVVDDFFHFQLLDAGMGRIRAWYFWKAVRAFGWIAASADEPYPAVRSAP